MKIKEFNSLLFDEKLFIVVDEGTFVENYVTKDIRMNLYTIFNFYVELVYSRELNKIQEIRSLNIGPHLDKYLIKI